MGKKEKKKAKTLERLNTTWNM